MEKKYLILSDIHGNVSALDAVLSECVEESFDGIILLGDLIDYGMRSNQIIQKLTDLENGIWKNRILVNIWGNHEKLYVDKDYEKLSSDRGRIMAQYTSKHITLESSDYIKNHMNITGLQEFNIGDLFCLAVHGSLNDHYWKAIGTENLQGEYLDYDIVFGGHSHYSHCFSHFYSVDCPKLRNKKSVMFINPGSVGQPRNQNPYAQYAVLYLPSKRVELRATEYDIAFEQALFTDEVDEFYKNRLATGV